MAGLVGYASSDEEEEEEREGFDEQSEALQAAEINSEAEVKPAPVRPSESKKETKATAKEEYAPAIAPQPNAVPLGPSLPTMEESLVAPDAPSSAPSSPYSANRALMQDLTLPAIPNLEIPPSPPGSPPPGANHKFEQFLALKRKGTHFNAKLDQSAALHNPSLMDKLLGFVEVDGRDQYATTLPPDLWDPAAFPDWAFRDRLRKSREAVTKEREAEKAGGVRGPIDFVPSSSTPTAGSSASGGQNKSEKRKSGWK